jgi:PPP family 3-phenylpropionic acid transporter
VGAFFLSAALMCGAHMALYAFYSLYLERAGYSKPMIGAMWALGVVAEVAFFYFQARVFARFGARRVMLFACGCAVLRFAVTGAAPGLPWLMLAAQLLHAATFAAHHSACVIAMQRWFAGPLQASGQALYMSVAYGLGCTLGGLVLTLCWDKLGAQQMFQVAGAMALAGAAAAWYSFRLQGNAA